MMTFKEFITEGNTSRTRVERQYLEIHQKWKRERSPTKKEQLSQKLNLLGNHLTRSQVERLVRTL